MSQVQAESASRGRVGHGEQSFPVRRGWTQAHGDTGTLSPGLGLMLSAGAAELQVNTSR